MLPFWNYFTNIANEKFGKLTAIFNTNQLDQITHTYIWHCKCECGNEKDVSIALLRAGHCLSCGQCNFNSKGEYLIASLLSNNNIKF